MVQLAGLTVYRVSRGDHVVTAEQTARMFQDTIRLHLTCCNWQADVWVKMSDAERYKTTTGMLSWLLTKSAAGTGWRKHMGGKRDARAGK